MSKQDLADEFVVVVAAGPGNSICVDLLSARWDRDDVGMVAALAAGLLGVLALDAYLLPMVAFVGGYVVAYLSLAWLTRDGMAAMADRAALPLLCDMLDERYAGAPAAMPRIQLTVVDETKAVPTWASTLLVGAMCCAAQAMLPGSFLAETALALAVVVLNATVLGGGHVLMKEVATDRAELRAWASDGQPLRNAP